MPEHPKQLADHHCILDASIRQPGRWRFQVDNATRYFSVRPVLEVNGGEAAAEFAADGLGIALLPDFLVRKYLDSRTAGQNTG